MTALATYREIETAAAEMGVATMTLSMWLDGGTAGIEARAAKAKAAGNDDLVEALRMAWKMAARGTRQAASPGLSAAAQGVGQPGSAYCTGRTSCRCHDCL